MAIISGSYGIGIRIDDYRKVLIIATGPGSRNSNVFETAGTGFE